MKNFVAAATVAAAVAFATPAFAQDGLIEPYGGVLVGYDNVRVSVAGESGHQDGFVYGGVLGVQSTVGSSAVIGLEGEVTGSTTKESASDLLVAGDHARIKAGRDFFIGARAGIRTSSNLLVYAKGGYTNARATLRYTDASGTFEDGDNLDGYRIGAGVEFGKGKLRFRGEYRFSDYGNYKIQGVDTGISAQRHQVVLGAIYAF